MKSSLHIRLITTFSLFILLVACIPATEQISISPTALSQPTKNVLPDSETPFAELPQLTNTPLSMPTNWMSFTNSNYVRALLIDTNGDLWAGGNGGAIRWNINSGSFIKYLSEDGLAGNFVTAMAQSQDGTIWFGTYGGGVSWFDGETWKTFTTKDGLSDDRILSLAVAPDNSIWAGTLSGISKYDHERWISFESDSVKEVVSIAVTSDNIVWIGGDWQTGLKRIKDGVIEDWSSNLGEDNLVTALSTAPDGTLWIGTHYGVVHYDGLHWQRHTLLDEELIAVSSLAVTNDGQVWVGLSAWMGYSMYDRPENTHGYNQGLPDHLPGIWHFDGNNWQLIEANNGPLENDVRAIVVDQAGSVWIGHTTKGISRYDGQNWTSFQTQNEVPTNQISKLAIAPNGQIWLAQPGLGLHHFDGKKWKSFTEVNGLEMYVLSIHVDQNGTVWVGTSDGLAQLAGELWTIYRREDYDWMGGIYSISELHDGSHLITTDGAAILDEAGWTVLPFEEIGVKGAQAANGDLWFSTFINGVYSWSGKKWKHFTLANGLPSEYVSDMAAAPNGAMWFTSCDKIFYIYREIWEVYLENSEQENDTCIGGDILADNNGNIWLSTYQGIMRIDERQVTKYTTMDGLASNKTNALAVENNGNVWIGTDAGLSKFSPSNP